MSLTNYQLIGEAERPNGVNYRRRYKRVRMALEGAYMRENREEVPCQLIDISVAAAALASDIVPAPGEKLLINFPEIGTLTGTVFRRINGGVIVNLEITDRRREKLAAQLTWLLNREDFPDLEIRRSGSIRRSVENETRTVMLPDGASIDCQVVDISATGISLRTDTPPAIGKIITIGRWSAHVVRHHDSGFAATFLQDRGDPTGQKMHG